MYRIKFSGREFILYSDNYSFYNSMKGTTLETKKTNIYKCQCVQKLLSWILHISSLYFILSHHLGYICAVEEQSLATTKPS